MNQRNDSFLYFYTNDDFNILNHLFFKTKISHDIIIPITRMRSLPFATITLT